MYVCLSYLNADIFALLFTPRSFQVSNQGPDFCYCIPGKYLVCSSNSLWVHCPLWVFNTLLIFCFFLSRSLGGVPAHKKKEKAHCERCRHTFLCWRGHNDTHTKEHSLPISSFVIKARKKEGCWQMLIAPASRQWRGKPRPTKCRRDQKWVRANSVHTWHDHCSIALVAVFFNWSDRILHNNKITDNLWRDLQLPWLKSSTSVESRSTFPSLPPVTINIWTDYLIYCLLVGNPDHTRYLSKISQPIVV